jgi:ABC-type phosphate/phosphonate transport system substrate-binding protein
LFPLAYFKRMGVKDYMSYLKEAYFTGTYTDAIYDVLAGKADIGATKTNIFEKTAETDGRVKKDIVILERSADVPEGGFAVRKGLDLTLKNKLKQVLLDMYKDPEGQNVLEQIGARRFVGTTDEDYRAVYDFVRQLGIDPRTYDYGVRK